MALGGAVESPPFYGFVVAATAEAAFYTYRATDEAVAPTTEGDVVTRPAFRGLLSLGYGF